MQPDPLASQTETSVTTEKALRLLSVYQFEVGTKFVAAFTALTAERDALRAEVVRKDEALTEVVACMMNGGDGQVGDFGWRIGRLTKARPMIRAALAPRDPNAADTRGEEHEHG